MGCDQQDVLREEDVILLLSPHMHKGALASVSALFLFASSAYYWCVGITAFAHEAPTQTGAGEALRPPKWMRGFFLGAPAGRMVVMSRRTRTARRSLMSMRATCRQKPVRGLVSVAVISPLA